MKKEKKRFSFVPFGKSLVVFALTLLLCILLLFAVCALIPQSAVAENCREAEEYFSKKEPFPLLNEGVEGSRLDHYADCALFNVIYNTDSDSPFSSLIRAPYYRVEGNDIREDYRTALNGETPNSDYARYWHGSQILLRPLLTFTSVEGCRGILFGLLLILNGVLLFLLLRKKHFLPAIAYVLSLCAVRFWVTAFTLEYITVFLILAAVCIAAALISQTREEKREGAMTLLCIVSGTVTCFLDFLTAETLTFTVPVLLFLMLNQKSKDQISFKNRFKSLVKWGLAWLLAYAATFAVKWLLVLALSGPEAFAAIFTDAMYRIDGEAESISLWMVPIRNLAALLPFSEGITVAGTVGYSLAILGVCGAVLYLFRGDRLNLPYLGSLGLLALLPYARFFLLTNHSYIHSFFTYRAQMATVFALIAIMTQGLAGSPLFRRKKAKLRKGAKK